MAAIIVKLEHARQLGYCARGMRRWFEGREHTWQEFVAQGVPADWLLAQDDAMATEVARVALEAASP